MALNLATRFDQLVRAIFISSLPKFTLGLPGDTDGLTANTTLHVTVRKPTGTKESIRFYFNRPDLLQWENKPVLRELIRQIEAMGFKPESLNLKTSRRVYTYWTKKLAQ